MDDNIYVPFNESGTMLPPDPELVDKMLAEEDEAEYSTYAEEAEQVTYQPYGKLPEYYTKDEKTGQIKAITKAEFKAWRRKNVTVRYQKVPMCGHKFVPGAQPRHRNCEACWFAFFNVHGELTQSIEELFAKHGAKPVVTLLGPKVLKNFLKFMSTIASLKAAQEAKAAERSQEIKDSFIPPPAQGDVDGNTVGIESSSGEEVGVIGVAGYGYGAEAVNAIHGDTEGSTNAIYDGEVDNIYYGDFK